MMHKKKFRIPGRYLFIGGEALFYRMPMSANHLSRHLGDYVEQLDIVGYGDFYGGEPAPFHHRLLRGFSNILRDRVSITMDGSVRLITVRKLPLGEKLDLFVQGLWIYPNLRPELASVYDAGIVYNPEDLLTMLFLRADKRVRNILYLDVDNHASYYPRPWSGVIGKLEQACIRRADGVISVSRPLEELRRQQGAGRIRYVPNGVDFQLFNNAVEERAEHPPTLLYVGTLDRRWGVDLAIRAMPLLREHIPDARLLIAGDGPAEGELKELTASLDLNDSIFFKGLVQYTDLPALMAEADLGIATSRKDAFRHFASPLKIFEYMAAGLPVVCSGGGDAERITEESGAGVNIPFSPEVFAREVLELITSPERLSAASRTAVEYARQRDWEHQTEQVASFLAEVTGSYRTPHPN